MKTKITPRHFLLAGGLLLTGLAVAQSRIDDQPAPAQRPRPGAANIPPTPPPGQFGAPLPNLTISEFAAFTTGRTEFENVETPLTGLGPIFNNVSCAACHSTPATGGSSDIFVTRFGRNVNGHFDPLVERGGSLLQQFAIDPAAREIIPREANVIAHRQTTPLFGMGLIEAIPDSAILQNAARPMPDGIHGRAAIITDVVSGQNRVGHFGWKAQQATLLAFAADAYVNEMGITSRFFPTENAPNGNTNILARFDHFADPEDEVDPETGKGDIDLAADFMRLLGPPPQIALSPSAKMGQALFTQIGCANCHQPVMQTGPSAVQALNQKPVPLYSDLLLHDMGRLNDGIGQGNAGPREMKTPPLWGLRATGPYLHDGRARTVDEAIRAHDGEATPSSVRYQQMNPQQARQLLDFLNSI